MICIRDIYTDDKVFDSKGFLHEIKLENSALVSTNGTAERVINREIINMFFELLTPIEKTVIYLLYFESWTGAEISREYGRHRSWSSHIKQGALKKGREWAKSI